MPLPLQNRSRFGILVVAVAASLLWHGSGCQKRAARARPNVLLVVWDTVRADRLSCYGYDQPTTPWLDSFVSGARLFRHVVSPSSWTVPVHAALFTGTFPSVTGVSYESRRLSDRFETLAERLQHSGYRTYLFSANPFVAEPQNLLQGFETVEHPWEDPWKARLSAALKARNEGLAEDVARPRARFKNAGPMIGEAFFGWLDRQDTGEPFFAYLNYMEAHWPLTVDPEEVRPFLRPELMAQVEHLDQSYARRLAHMLGHIDLPSEELELYEAHYAAAIRRLDGYFAGLVETLKSRDLLESTVVILLSDHGENLGDHHLMGHRYSVHDSLLRVPLVIRYPSRFEPGVSERRVQSLDVFPTILELTGIALDEGEAIQGRSLFEEPSASEEVRRLYSEYLPPARIGRLWEVRAKYPGFRRDERVWLGALRSVEADRFKLIEAVAGFHELYDLEADPLEQDNLASSQPERVEELKNELQEWFGTLKVLGGRASSRSDLSPEALERIRSLGYLDENP